MVCLSLGLSVPIVSAAKTPELIGNVIWDVDSGWPKEPCIR